jgi:hypothetical protein
MLQESDFQTTRVTCYQKGGMIEQLFYGNFRAKKLRNN